MSYKKCPKELGLPASRLVNGVILTGKFRKCKCNVNSVLNKEEFRKLLEEG